MKRRSASVSRAIPSTADLTLQTENMFNNAGRDIPPVRVRSSQDAMEELEYLESNIAEGVDWDTQVSAMQHGMGLVNGGALEYDDFVRGLNRIASGLISAATNLRSALVKQSCLFIAQIAREVGSAIDLIGDFITPLSSQLSHGTQIIAESSKCASLAVAKSCPSRRVLKSIFDIGNSRGSAVKTVAAQSLALVIGGWPIDIINANITKIEAVMTKLLGDAAVETRTEARRAAKAYLDTIPQRGSEFLARLDQRTQKAIRSEPAVANEPRRQVSNYSTRLTTDVNSRTVVEKRRPSPKPRNDMTVKPPERADIAANPPKVLQKKTEADPMRRTLRAPSVNRTTRVMQDDYDNDVRTQRYSASSRVGRPRVPVEDDDDDDIPVRRPRARRPVQEEPEDRMAVSTGRMRNERRQRRVIDDDYEEPAPQPVRGRTSRLREEPVDDDSEEEIIRRPQRVTTTRYERTEAPKRSYSQIGRRQGSVQPVRRGDLGNEKKKPIRLQEGEEKTYLQHLREFVDEERTTELASSMPFISRDLIGLCSNNSPSISSQALQILHDLLSVYAPHFRAILPSLVEMVLGQCEIGNPRSSSTASLILADLHKSFDSGTLLQICLRQTPSIPLLNFAESLVSADDGGVDISSDTICQKLLMLAFRCYNLGTIKNRHTAARIVQSVNDANSGAITRFANALRDQQLRQFEEFISPYIPDLRLRTVTTEVPRFNPKSPVSWRRRLQNVVEATRDDADWEDVRPKVLAELNESLLERKDPSALDLAYSILTNRGFEDFERILPGVLVNSRGETAKSADMVLTAIVRNCDPADVFTAIQPLIVRSDGDMVRAALGFQTRLISMIDAKQVAIVMPSMITGLTKSFEAELPEVRKAVVLCFVELYAKLGKELMDRHTSHLSKGQQKLIAIYLSRRK